MGDRVAVKTLRNLPPLKGVLFDFGGVLAEEGFRGGLYAIARKNGRDPEWFFLRASDAIYETGYITGQATEADYWEALRRETGICGTDEELTGEILPRFILRPVMIDWSGRPPGDCTPWRSEQRRMWRKSWGICQGGRKVIRGGDQRYPYRSEGAGQEGRVNISRSVFHVAVAGWAALIATAVVPAAVSAASCRLHDPNTLRNIAYRGIYDNAVTLQDGVYEGKPFVPGGASRPRVELLDMTPVLHEMDGDGIDDAVVLLAESSGGSGVFTFLAVVACRDGRAVNVGTTGLGNRVMIRSMAGRDGAIVVEIVAAGPGEPLCCPTRKVRNAYRLRDGKLLLASSEVQGTLSLADLKGVTWRLSHLRRNEPVPEGVKVTAVFGDGSVSGSSGCNRYSAAVVENDPPGFSIGPAASTKMACPDPAGGFEDRYFSALQAANRFGFLLGNLVLHYGKGDAREIMIFEREFPR